MKYFNFDNFVHHVFMENSFILLLEKTDEFIILDEKNSSILMDAFQGALHPNDASTIEKLSILSIIKEGENIQKINYGYSPVYSKKISYKEVSVKNIKAYKFIKMLFILIRNKIYLKLNCFHNLLQKLRNKKNIGKNSLTKTNPDELKKLISTYKLISKIIPIKLECLDFSLCILSLLPNEVEKKLLIGVKKYNFYSHAWITVEDFCISYDDINHSDLLVILEV